MADRSLATAAVLERDGDGVIRLSGTLDFDTVPVLYARTGTVFAGDGEIVVDAGGVERTGTAGVALLLEWLAESRRRDRTLSFRGLPSSLLAIADLCGVADLLTAGHPKRTPRAAL